MTSTKRRTVGKAISIFAATAVAVTGLSTVAHATETPESGATAAPALERIPQNEMQAVWSSSPVATNEGPNGGALEKILDGNRNSYWHTQWSPSVIQPPHSYIVKLGDTAKSLAKIVLTPRQSSNGSGRAHEWDLELANSPTCNENTAFTLNQSGAFSGDVDQRANDQEIIIKPAVEATCVKFTQRSSWGGHTPGDTVSRNESVASLAEFNAYTGEWPEDTDDSEDTTVPTIPDEELLTLTDGTLTVKMHKNFPQVYEWQLGGATADGMKTPPVAKVLIDETEHDVTVTPGEVTATSATYDFAVNGTQVTFKAVATVQDGVWKLELTNLTDPQSMVHRIMLPTLSLVSLKPTEHLATATISVNRAVSGDRFGAASSFATGHVSYMTVATTENLSFGMDNNAVADNTARYQGSNAGNNSKWINIFRNNVGQVIPGSFVWLSPSSTVIGHDPNPYIVVKPTADANEDQQVTWQDGAIALRDLRPDLTGSEDVKNTVITRIPFNIVSQATHPFLRTLDDTKRVSLATDGLRQQVMLKGYQAEGHDSAHPDYAGNYNERAGGFKDLVVLAEESAKWNATLGVHVNSTESYSESKNFSEDLLKMPPQRAWGWMNQSYYIDGPKDLGTGEVLKRFQAFRDEAPENLKWLYMDVYYPYGWQGNRLSSELNKQGWVVGTEWADRFIETSVWSHWANDEKYGGERNKGVSSQLFRFVENHRRDIFNPHPILSNSNVVEFEGWTGHVDYNKFIKNIWERNLPTKFLQQSPIMRWENNSITFKNGTVATSPLNSIAGTVIPTNRVIEFDGAKVYEAGKYLLPWTDGNSRLYHWNPQGTPSTWTLTNAWRNQASLKLFKLTDQGREEVATVPVENGQITLDTEANVAYVLYPTSAVPEAVAPNWGQGSMINDPGFFSGTLDAYTTTGDVTIEKTERANLQAVLGADAASLSQALNGGNLPAGTYNVSAWIEITDGKNREVSLSVEGAGVTPTKLQTAVNGVPTTTITSSRTRNTTASDEKLGTYFQRARVTFNTTGGKVDFKIAAGAGDALVKIDDLRIVKFVDPTLPTGVNESQVVVFENYENPDAGYWPFVTGPDQRGDARTQLAVRHAPYSQAGWWGVNPAGVPTEGYKLIDNVLDGEWSLMMHEENQGVILRTSEATVPFKANHRYRISFDFQNAYADSYAFVTGFDSLTGDQISTKKERVSVFPATSNTEVSPATGTTQRFTHELNVGSCGAYWFGIEKIGSGWQRDMSIDNILVEDLGESTEPPACANLTIVGQPTLTAGKTTLVKTRLTSTETTTATNVKHLLVVPEGWSVTAVDETLDTVEPGSDSFKNWLVTPPVSAAGTTATLEATASYDLGGTLGKRFIQATKAVKVSANGLAGGKNYLSDLPFVDSQNGWGPVERDMNNGDQAQGDGGPIRIDGTTYEKGLGAHANSTIRFNLGGQCTQFHAVVGVDDQQTSRGTIRFSVTGDDRVVVPETGVIRANTPALTLEGDVTGVNELVLTVTNAGDGNGNDWASWGDAYVICDATEPPVTPTLTGVPSPVNPGEVVTFKVTGFTHGQPAILVDSITGVKLGDLTIAEDGTASFEYTVPADYMAKQLHVGAVQHTDNGWAGANTVVMVNVKTTNLVVPPVTSDTDATATNTAETGKPTGNVKTPVKPNLPATGSSSLQLSLLALALAAVGTLAVRQRRRS